MNSYSVAVTTRQKAEEEAKQLQIVNDNLLQEVCNHSDLLNPSGCGRPSSILLFVKLEAI